MVQNNQNKYENGKMETDSAKSYASENDYSQTKTAKKMILLDFLDFLRNVNPHELQHWIPLVSTVFNLIFTPTYFWYGRKLLEKGMILPKHKVFEMFRTAANDLVGASYTARNPIRYRNIDLWFSKSNEFIREFCEYVIQKEIVNLPKSEFNVALQHCMNDQLNAFKEFTWEHFDEIVRTKFAQNTIAMQSRLAIDIMGYLAENGLSNKRKLWYILNDISKYLALQKDLIDLLNSLNSDLDLYEKQILMNNKLRENNV